MSPEHLLHKLNAEHMDAAASLTPLTQSALGDKRRVARSRALLAGKIVYREGAASLDCTIRDLTETGARVKLAGPEPMPSLVWLLEMRRGLAFHARVAWTKDRELGLAFLDVQSLDTPTTPVIARMRQLWLERLPR